MKLSQLWGCAILLALGGCEQATPPPPPVETERGFAQIAPAGLTEDLARHAHGERLASILGCRGCHAKDLRGKRENWADDPAIAVIYSSNLTRAMVGYDDAALERAIRDGVRPDGSPLWIMPSETFHRLNAADMQALISYLRSVPVGGESTPPSGDRPAGTPDGGKRGNEADAAICCRPKVERACFTCTRA